VVLPYVHADDQIVSADLSRKRDRRIFFVCRPGRGTKAALFALTKARYSGGVFAELSRGIMRLSRIVAVSAAVLALSAGLAAIPAEAQSRTRGDTERITVTDENGRTRTKITVRPRSYLDPGKETLPFDQHYHDYALPVGSGTPYYDRNDFKGSFSRMPMPGPFDLPNWPY
jgi:hypothetical protein